MSSLLLALTSVISKNQDLSLYGNLILFFSLINVKFFFFGNSSTSFGSSCDIDILKSKRNLSSSLSPSITKVNESNFVFLIHFLTPSSEVESLKSL